MSSGIPFNHLVLTTEQLMQRRRSAIVAFMFGAALMLGAAGLFLLTQLLADPFALRAVWAVQAGTSAVGVFWLGRGAFLKHRYGPVSDKPTNAALILAKHQDPVLERALFNIEQQGRKVSRMEARGLLARHYQNI